VDGVAVTAPSAAGRDEPHEALIVKGSAYSMEGPNTNLPANPRWPAHYPMEAICAICHGVVRREEMTPGKLDWEHTGRKAGEPREARTH
jgi:hypothetical protein